MSKKNRESQSPSEAFVHMPTSCHVEQSRIPSNCAFTTQHSSPDAAQTNGAPPTAGLAMPNGGLQVVNPSQEIYDTIIARLSTPSSTENYEFADQSLLADVFPGRWVTLPYIYNALKTLRWKGVHDAIWRDENIKNIHYILSPKPWDETEEVKQGIGEAAKHRDPTNAWWWKVTDERRKEEKSQGVADRF